MSKQSNPTLIGMFIVGAIALVAVAVVLFGGAEVLQEKQKYMTYFDRSVKGLRVGSNVLFKGVRVGYVTDIRLVGDIDTLEFGIPVVFEVLPDSVTVMQGEKSLGTLTDRETIDLQRLIDAGLRAQLNSESFVTGQLVIELDLVPDSPVVMRGKNPPYPEVPSIPSDIQQAIQNVQRFIREVQTTADVPKMIEHIGGILSGIDRVVNSEELTNSLAGIEQIVTSDDTQNVTRDLRVAVADFRTVMSDARLLINNTDAEIGEIAESLDPALRSLDKAIAEGANVLESLGDQLGRESEVNYELVKTLNEIQGAARSLRVLLEYLESHPESVLKGKSE